MKAKVVTRADYKKYAPYLFSAPEGEGTIIIGVETGEGEVAGTAVFIKRDSWVEMSSIYVRPSLRRLGVARLMLETIKRVRDKMEYFTIVADFSESAEGIRDLLDSESFFITEGKTVYEFTLQEAASLIDRDKNVKTENVRPLSEMDPEELRECGLYLERFGWKKDLIYEQSCRKDLSIAGYSEGVLCGIIVISQEEENVLSIDRLAATNGKQLIFTSLVRSMVIRMIKTEKIKTCIRFCGENDRIVAMTAGMLGDELKKVDQYYTAVG